MSKDEGQMRRGEASRSEWIRPASLFGTRPLELVTERMQKAPGRQKAIRGRCMHWLES